MLQRKTKDDQVRGITTKWKTQEKGGRCLGLTGGMVLPVCEVRESGEMTVEGVGEGARGVGLHSCGN